MINDFLAAKRYLTLQFPSPFKCYSSMKAETVVHKYSKHLPFALFNLSGNFHAISISSCICYYQQQ